MKKNINTQYLTELSAQEKLEQMLNMMDDIDKVCKSHKPKIRKQSQWQSQLQ